MGIEFAIQVLDKAGAYRTDLLNDAMVQFEHGPIIRSVLAGSKATIQCTGEKRSQQDRETFSKNWPLRKLGVLPS